MPNLEEALLNVQNSFAKGATELATQCATEWCYKVTLAIKGFKFMTPIGYLMMWRAARITGGSMEASYNPWRTLGNEKECA
jgi:hypothetical protein